MKSSKTFGGIEGFNKALRGVTSTSSLTAPNSKSAYIKLLDIIIYQNNFTLKEIIKVFSRLLKSSEK